MGWGGSLSFAENRENASSQSELRIRAERSVPIRWLYKSLRHVVMMNMTVQEFWQICRMDGHGIEQLPFLKCILNSWFQAIFERQYLFLLKFPALWHMVRYIFIQWFQAKFKCRWLNFGQIPRFPNTQSVRPPSPWKVFYGFRNSSPRSEAFYKCILNCRF